MVLVLFPQNEGGKGSHNGQIWRETTSTSYPGERWSAPAKLLVVTMWWDRRWPPSWRPGSLDLVAWKWKPLADSLGLRACACLFSTKEETCCTRPAGARLALVVMTCIILTSWGEGSHGNLRSSGASLKRPLLLEILVCPPREAWPPARVLCCCRWRWAVPSRRWRHAVGCRRANLDTPVSRTPTSGAWTCPSV